MKAAWFETFGPAEETIVIGEQPTPTAGPGEVLVRMKATGVNPSDVKKRAGAFPNLLDNGLVIPHSDGAGIIEAVGEGVDASRIGESIMEALQALDEVAYVRFASVYRQFRDINEFMSELTDILAKGSPK